MKLIRSYYTFFLFFAVFLVSCGNGSKNVKIGFLIRTYDLDRCVKERDFFSERAKELGAEVLVANADNNDQTQIQQGIDMLNNNVNVLVIFPVNGATAAAIVREANSRKVKVIAYESIIQNCKPDYFISANNLKGGELMAQYMIKAVPHGNYVLLGGDKADRNAVLIKTGQHNILDPFVKQGDIKIMYDVYADWSADEGYEETKQILRLSGEVPDAIIASNDGLATGVVKALEEENLAGKVPVTGLDAELVACQRVVKGTQTVTIYKSFKKQAYSAAEMAYQIATGKKPENLNAETPNGLVNVPSFLIEPVIVDKNNIDQVIVNDGVFTHDDVYKN